MDPLPYFLDEPELVTEFVDIVRQIVELERMRMNQIRAEGSYLVH